MDLGHLLLGKQRASFLPLEVRNLLGLIVLRRLPGGFRLLLIHLLGDMELWKRLWNPFRLMDFLLYDSYGLFRFFRKLLGLMTLVSDGGASWEVVGLMDVLMSCFIKIFVLPA